MLKFIFEWFKLLLVAFSMYTWLVFTNTSEEKKHILNVYHQYNENKNNTMIKLIYITKLKGEK